MLGSFFSLPFLSQLHYDCVTFMLWTIFRRKESHFWHIVCRYVFFLFCFEAKVIKFVKNPFLFCWIKVCMLWIILYISIPTYVRSTWIKFKEQKHRYLKICVGSIVRCTNCTLYKNIINNSCILPWKILIYTNNPNSILKDFVMTYVLAADWFWVLIITYLYF